jgi:hypothetical protein
MFDNIKLVIDLARLAGPAPLRHNTTARHTPREAATREPGRQGQNPIASGGVLLLGDRLGEQVDALDAAFHPTT